jgi:hypothetical protein
MKTEKYTATTPWTIKTFDDCQTVILDANGRMVCTVLTGEGFDVNATEMIVGSVNNTFKDKQ